MPLPSAVSYLGLLSPTTPNYQERARPRADQRSVLLHPTSQCDPGPALGLQCPTCRRDQTKPPQRPPACTGAVLPSMGPGSPIVRAADWADRDHTDLCPPFLLRDMRPPAHCVLLRTKGQHRPFVPYRGLVLVQGRSNLPMPLQPRRMGFGDRQGWVNSILPLSRPTRAKPVPAPHTYWGHRDDQAQPT